MSILNDLQGVFGSPATHAAAWGFAASFVLCVLLVITKRWHGALTMDFTNAVPANHPVVVQFDDIYGKENP